MELIFVSAILATEATENTEKVIVFTEYLCALCVLCGPNDDQCPTPFIRLISSADRRTPRAAHTTSHRAHT